MRAGRASRTAQHNALFRALEAARAPRCRLVDDHLAAAFLGWPYSFVARLAELPGAHALVPRFIDHRWPGVRTALVARTRLIDDMIAAASAAPFEQAVVLGAGFDTRGYRLAALRATTVFEVDHPDTQAAKRAALARALPALPPHVRFVPVDFQRDALAAAMEAAGYRATARTFILWEGVTNYLTEAAVDATLRWCAGAAAGSRLLFTYVHRDVLVRPEIFAGSRQLFAALARAGERFTFGIDPAELADYLAARGLALESDIGAADYRRRYYGDAARAMRGHEFYRVALARVAKGGAGA
jgi:methyltransferase (TIGR00027 family)